MASLSQTVVKQDLAIIAAKPADLAGVSRPAQSRPCEPRRKVPEGSDGPLNPLIEIRRELVAEAVEAARQSGLPLHAWVNQVVEGYLVDRRCTPRPGNRTQ